MAVLDTWKITVTGPDDTNQSSEVVQTFDKLLGRALATIEDELRHRFGDVGIDVDHR